MVVIKIRGQVIFQVFLDEEGMELFLDVLNTFPGEAAIETKILGLLNNIAEVHESGSLTDNQPLLQVQWLRSSLLVDPFIDRLRELLHSKSIEV